MAVMAETIVHNRNVSKIDTPGQNYVATVFQIIEISHSTASLVHWNNFYSMMKVFCCYLDRNFIKILIKA